MGEKYIPVVIVITVQSIITLQRKTCVNSYIPPRNSLSNESLPPSCFRKISALLDRLKCPEFLAMNIGQNVCVHQRMVKGKEKKPLKQYISIQPIKTGTKIWEMALSCCGYLHDFKCIEGEVVEILTER